MISGQVSQWFQLYFTNRKQRILIKYVLSNEFDVKYGVPQGSCAGPVIFLSYLSPLYDPIAQYDVNVGDLQMIINSIYLSSPTVKVKLKHLMKSLIVLLL